MYFSWIGSGFQCAGDLDIICLMMDKPYDRSGHGWQQLMEPRFQVKFKFSLADASRQGSKWFY